MRYSAAVHTLGCRVNQYEGDCIISGFMNAGFDIKNFSDAGCDVYVINTCTVTAGSDKKSRQHIRRAKNLSPRAVIAVCGCFSQANPDISGLQADIIIGTPGKTKIPGLAIDILKSRESPPARPPPARASGPRILVGDIAAYSEYENISADFSENTRAYIKIQDGCEAACSFCIVPQVRGREKSRAYADIYAEAKRFNDAGHHEIVLTGIEISGYGRGLSDGPASLIGLLEKLNGEPGLANISSIRLSSVDPFIIRRDFVDRLSGLAKAANHLHLSLQSGSPRILALMRRRYNAEQVRANISYARAKIAGLNLTADIIAGFPGETDGDFEQSLELIRDLSIYHAHVFTYSRRPGTDAAGFAGQVPENIKSARGKITAQACGQIREQIHAGQVGREFDVILEDTHAGKTRNFMDVRVAAPGLRGSVRRVKITGYDKNFLYGGYIDGFQGSCGKER